MKNSDTKQFYTTMDSPLGCLLLTSDGKALTGVQLIRAGERFEAQAGWIEDESATVLREARQQLEEYFRGDRRVFNLPLSPAGTDFQRSVWKALLKIPFGTTTTYGELASRMGNSNASRAVGQANGRNPIMIVIPCHRVVGSTGKLTGFSAGLPAKESLLALETGG